MPGPTDLEQLLLEYVNAARLNPLGDAAHYVNGYTPLTSPDAGIQSAINFFGVSGPAFFAQMSALTATQPLAWNDSIAAASRAHSQAMINADSHRISCPASRALATASRMPAITSARSAKIFSPSRSRCCMGTRAS